MRTQLLGPEGDEARGVSSSPYTNRPGMRPEEKQEWLTISPRSCRSRPSSPPTSVLIVPLSSNKAFEPHIARISQKLRAAQISSRVDDSSASIGKRYSRNDELGTPLGVTIDFQTAKDGTITLRDRDSTKQVRADEDRILAAIREMVSGEKDVGACRARAAGIYGPGAVKKKAGRKHTGWLSSARWTGTTYVADRLFRNLSSFSPELSVLLC